MRYQVLRGFRCPIGRVPATRHPTLLWRYSIAGMIRGGNGGQAAFERFDSARELPLAGRPATDAIDPNRTFAARIAPPHSGRWVSPHAVENASTRRNRHTTDVRLYSPWIAGPGRRHSHGIKYLLLPRGHVAPSV